MPLCEIGYRYIPRYEYMTPKMHLPMQRMRLDVKEPYGDEQVIDAIFEFFGDNWFESRSSICDIECFVIEDK